MQATISCTSEWRGTIKRGTPDPPFLLTPPRRDSPDLLLQLPRFRLGPPVLVACSNLLTPTTSCSEKVAKRVIVNQAQEWQKRSQLPQLPMPTAASCHYLMPPVL